MEAHARRGIVLLMFTFAAPCGPSWSFVTWSLACLARSDVFVLVRVLPKKKDILSVYRRRGGVEGLAIDASPSAEPGQVARVGSCELKGPRMLKPAALGREARRAKQIANASPDSSNSTNNKTVAPIKGFGR